MDIKNKLNIFKATDLLNLCSITPPHIQLCGEQQKESYRKERDIWYKIKLSYSVLIKKISSLLSVDYYKSNKKNQFKDIQLQLHATNSVSNPYTFSIQGNKSFSGSCELDKTLYKMNAYILSVSGAGSGIMHIGYSINNSNTSISPNVLKGATIQSFVSTFVNSNWQFTQTRITLSKKIADTITLEIAGTENVYVFHANTVSNNNDNNTNTYWSYLSTEFQIVNDGIYEFYLY